ncbi:MAG: hypothetical protein IPK58_21975 [Acidobacteria bacterium]|nr:hypothetical protein [Acidobacteriota bacterium]
MADATRALCFVAGTLVHTDEGLVPIELIEPGDSVLSYNETNGQLEFREVVRLFRNTADEFLKIQIEGEPQTLQVTLGHPFYVHRNRNNLSADDGDWIAAESLKAGDLLKNSAGEWKPIIAIERVTESRATFNFEVEGNHNYFVGLGGWLVHNDCFRSSSLSNRWHGPDGRFITPPSADDMRNLARSNGWLNTKTTAAGFESWTDANGVVRMKIKPPSNALGLLPGSQGPRVTLKNAANQYVDGFGRVVRRRSTTTHAPIQ